MTVMNIRNLARAATALVSVGVVFSLSGCSLLFGPQYRDKSGQVTATASVDSDALKVGDCIYNVSDIGDTVSKVTVVPCDQPHEAELYSIGKSVANNKDDMENFCATSFADFDGIDIDSSNLSVTYIHSQTGDTTDVQCIAYIEGQMVTTSYKDSKQ